MRRAKAAGMRKRLTCGGRWIGYIEEESVVGSVLIWHNLIHGSRSAFRSSMPIRPNPGGSPTPWAWLQDPFEGGARCRAVIQRRPEIYEGCLDDSCTCARD